jgi:hypothetical protein
MRKNKTLRKSLEKSRHDSSALKDGLRHKVATSIRFAKISIRPASPGCAIIRDRIDKHDLVQNSGYFAYQIGHELLRSLVASCHWCVSCDILPPFPSIFPLFPAHFSRLRRSRDREHID